MGFKDIESRAKALVDKKFRDEQKQDEQQNTVEEFDSSKA